MQAALQGGAITSRPTVAEAGGRALLSMVRACAPADSVSEARTSSAEARYFVVMARIPCLYRLHDHRPYKSSARDGWRPVFTDLVTAGILKPDAVSRKTIVPRD
jgi:hypothetical protein